MVPYLLPFPVDSVDVIVAVVMGWHYKHAFMGVVLVAEILLRQLPVPVVALPNIGFGVAVGILLWGLVGSVLRWEVVLQYLRTVVWISGGGIPWCCR